MKTVSCPLFSEGIVIVVLGAGGLDREVEGDAAIRDLAWPTSRPPWASTMDRQIDRPSPMPFGLVVTNGWNRFAATTGARPGPVSLTVTSTMSSNDAAVPMVRSRTGDWISASMALRTRFSTTCWICILSIQTGGASGARLKCDPDILLLGADQRKGAGFLDDLVDGFRRPVRLPLLDEIAHPPDDLAGAGSLRHGLVHGFQHLDRRLAVGRVHHAAAGLDIIGDRRQRLVQFMRQGGGHLAHGAEAGDVQQFALQVLKPLFRVLVLGQVADEAGEQAAAGQIDLADRQIHREGSAIRPLADDDAADADDPFLARGEIVMHVAVMSGAIGGGHQDADIPADHLGGG